MRPVVMTHVYHLTGFLYGLERRLDHSIRLTYKRHNSTVGGLTRVNVQKLYALTCFYHIRDLFYHCLVAPLH